ncbi:MAG: BlaI/MecI/CopY family transcriptional regulator [Defluviitaleaceae bacterium]|nr:BlaI/MecI/CopY family transcriptional regulator [Defluviitaleaceae bacterium]
MNPQKPPKTKISDAELEVMRIIWRENQPQKAAVLQDELKQTKNWSRSTTNTLITRLRDKGFIEPTQRYGVARYIPLISEDEYLLAEEKNLLERFGSAKKLAIAMVRNKHLTSTDIDELREYFNNAWGDTDG